MINRLSQFISRKNLILQDLDMIVTNARTAADLGAEGYEDDSFEEEDEDDLEEEKGCRQLIER